MTDEPTPYLAQHPDWHAADAPAKAEAVVAACAALGWAPGTVVDVGSGSGHVLAHLARAWPAARIVGWEPAADARALAPEGVELHAGLPGRDVRADLVMALDVAEHVPDDIGFLSGLGRIAPRAVLRLPLDVSVWDVLRPPRLAAVRARYGHRHVWTRAVALDRLDAAGWIPERVIHHRIPTPQTTWRQRMAEAVRAAAFAVAPAAAADVLGGAALVVAARRRGDANDG